MVLEILIPDIENNPKNTKDAIISVLTSEWPLSIKKIYNKLKKQFGYSNSYQSVYKSIKELKEKKVILQKNEGFEINIEWVKKLQSFTDIVETNYYAKHRMENLSGFKDSNKKENILVLNFDTIFDAEKYLYYFIKTELSKIKNDLLCFRINNEWKSIFYLRAEYNYYKKLSKRGHKFYFICSGNSQLEKDAESFYKMLGIKINNSKQSFPNDTVVFGDYFVQIFIPEKLKGEIKKFLEKEDIINLLKTLDKKTSGSIKIMINKDKDLAKEFKKQVTKEFK